MSVHYRQGDILLVAVEAIPDRAVAVPRDNGQVVLAYGEATGHRHAIGERHAELLAMPGEEVELRFLRIVEAEALLVYEEHDPVRLPAGIYQVIRQREYVPEQRAFRLVGD